MSLSARLFPMPAHVHRTALAHRDHPAPRVDQVLKDLEEREETQAQLVQWAPVENKDFQDHPDLQVHKALMACLCPENLAVLDQREIPETQA